ncbi:MAG TPA: ribosome biogenesis GTPase YlqF [Acholeplasmataceae bacterium]|nr:ribosome biogenesis GTPase YlqF [Acholeplasmataceae bacterium]
MSENKYKQIQWYPGHMFKSFREIKENIGLMDIVLILLDARIPFSSMNPEILKIIGEKPALLLFNKMDLADSNGLNFWIKHYEELGFVCLAIDAQTGKNVNKIKTLAEEILDKQISKRKSRGLLKKDLRTMILGIPNVGKSTLINKLAGRKSTKVGNTPGVTKTQQWIKLSNGFDLLDTPGVLWPKFEDPKVGYHLAVTGAIKDKILPEDDVCFYALTYIQKYHLNRLQERYDENIAQDSTYIEMLDMIGKKRGALIAGGEIDYDRVYSIVLHDIRNKALGALTFDRI